MQFEFAEPKGRACIVQASTNLLDWTNVSTNVAPVTFTIPLRRGVPYQFFRVRAVP